MRRGNGVFAKVYLKVDIQWIYLARYDFYFLSSASEISYISTETRFAVAAFARAGTLRQTTMATVTKGTGHDSWGTSSDSKA